MIQLYKKYVLQYSNHITNVDPKGIEEMARQINHLEKSIHNICESNSKRIERKEKDIGKKSRENATLIYDLNEIQQRNVEWDKTLINKKI